MPLLAALAATPACSGANEPEPVLPPLPTVIASLSAPAPAAPPAPTPPRADTSLPKRGLLFGNPDRVSPLISPDGKKISFLAPRDGVMNVWVAPADKPADAKPVTAEKERGIRRYRWAYTNDYILYVQDKGGDEDFHVLAVDLAKGDTKDLTPHEKTQARIEMLSSKHPGEVLVGLNNRDKKYHDLHRIEIKTGKSKLVLKNEGYSGFEVDLDFVPRFADKAMPDGSTALYPIVKAGKETKVDETKTFLKIPHEDALTTEMLGFDITGKTLYSLDSRDRNTSALVTIDLATGKPKLIASDAKADVQGTLLHPKDRRVQAVAVTYERKKWITIDPAIAADLEAIGKVADGDVDVVSRSLDDKRWIVAHVVSDGPARYYLYDKAKKKTEFLFSNLAALEKVKLSKMHARVIKSRDGLDLVSYLTLPPDADKGSAGVPDKPLPMVLLVHGGPWARDSWGMNPIHQWIASRGYAALSVNYRGSTGFGKSHVNASNKEWAGKMHDDLLDAVAWAVEKKIADKAKVAIMGGSYGGYATLVGLTFTPETFACGVDIVGPSSLVTLLEAVPPYWAPLVEQFTRRIGDHRTEEGKKFLLERSPISRVDKIQRPLLIGQGKNDPRVKQVESDRIVKAMQDKGIPVTYVLYPDEGHGFNRPENRVSFFAASEIFLAQCLAGPYEPVGGDFKGSSITVPSGVDRVFGLEEALKEVGK